MSCWIFHPAFDMGSLYWEGLRQGLELELDDCIAGGAIWPCGHLCADYTVEETQRLWCVLVLDGCMPVVASLGHGVDRHT